MPLRAAVAPAPGATGVVEVVEDVTGPGARNSGDQRAAGKIVGEALLVTKVLEIGQIAGGDQISGLTQVSVVGEGLALPVVEHGNIRLGLAGEVLVVVRPLEPLDGVPVPAGAALSEDRRKRVGGEPARGRPGRRLLSAHERRSDAGECRSAGDEPTQARFDGTTRQQREHTPIHEEPTALGPPSLRRRLHALGNRD